MKIKKAGILEGQDITIVYFNRTTPRGKAYFQQRIFLVGQEEIESFRKRKDIELLCSITYTALTVTLHKEGLND